MKLVFIKKTTGFSFGVLSLLANWNHRLSVKASLHSMFLLNWATHSMQQSSTVSTIVIDMQIDIDINITMNLPNCDAFISEK